MFHNVIQIAGIIDREEADLLMAAGVDFLGFPLRLPVNKEDLSEPDATRIIKTIEKPQQAVLITYLSEAQEIIHFCEQLNVSIVQLHGPISIGELKKLRRINSHLKIIKSVIVCGDNEVEMYGEIEKMSRYVDAFIIDTYDPETGASGATGKIHDWQLSRKLVEMSPQPVILAGGLTPENVSAAIMTVRPDGVDTHTGVESGKGRKDREKVRQFVAAARRAFAELEEPKPLELPINGVLDLHTFQPRDVKALVPDYLKSCQAQGIRSVRIIHGKGTGTLRRIVRSILSKSSLVESFEATDATGGGWGATSVVLRKEDNKAR
jgi:phosphoribosylanthranilate isomerase